MDLENTIDTIKTDNKEEIKQDKNRAVNAEKASGDDTYVPDEQPNETNETSEPNFFHSNIQHLAKLFKLKIGDIEKDMGVSVGYLSRLAPEKATSIGVDKARAVAALFNVSIESLVYKDLRSTLVGARTVSSFLGQLIDQTVGTSDSTHRIIWRRSTYRDWLKLIDYGPLAVCEKSDTTGSVLFLSTKNWTPEITPVKPVAESAKLEELSDYHTEFRDIYITQITPSVSLCIVDYDNYFDTEFPGNFYPEKQIELFFWELVQKSGGEVDGNDFCTTVGRCSFVINLMSDSKEARNLLKELLKTVQKAVDEHVDPEGRLFELMNMTLGK